eukprot:TRINITY_DN10531_c0_g2_i1.p1 TRINITY_DN10531_c0_g2~~TRINITY_DN10531_c0_g2_i1.p1  ORF type:complete len:168 (-),score=13.87 TRINITY_DN10531_c0_g2_i1:119-622(-)
MPVRSREEETKGPSCEQLLGFYADVSRRHSDELGDTGELLADAEEFPDGCSKPKGIRRDAEGNHVQGRRLLPHRTFASSADDLHGCKQPADVLPHHATCHCQVGPTTPTCNVCTASICRSPARPSPSVKRRGGDALDDSGMKHSPPGQRLLSRSRTDVVKSCDYEYH